MGDLERRQFSFRGTRFERTPKGYWIFDAPPLRGGYWDRYFTDDELKVLADKSLPAERGERIMREAINRHESGNVMYSGDIRYRGSKA